MTSYSVNFGLQDLVNYGIYKSIEAARIGVKGFYSSFLSMLKVAGKLKTGKKEQKQESIRVLFTGIDIKENSVTILLNKDINWNFIAAFHTLLPESVYFKLPKRGGRLLQEIFKIARQNTDKLKKDHCFYVTFETIRTWLALPENKTPKPTRDIKQQITNAVTDILETWQQEYPQEQTPGLTLELQCDDSLPIADYMKTGKLKVTLAGEYLAYFTELQDNITDKIEERRKQLEADKAKKTKAKDTAK